MGHQVNFYLDQDDTKKIESVLRSIGPLLVLHSRSGQPEPRVVDCLLHDEDSRSWLFYHLVRPEDLDGVNLRHVPAQGYWTVDVLTSPVVEFNGCFFDGAILRRGRVYYVDGFYDANQQWKMKSTGFRDWAKAALGGTRKALKKHQSDYIGTGAEAWRASGVGKLVT